MTIANDTRPHPFVLESDRALPESDRTVFFIKNPTLPDAMEIKKAVVALGNSEDAILTLVDVAFQKCLVGWEKLRRQDGSLVEHEKGKAVELLPATACFELTNEIVSRATLSIIDKKKSESPPGA